MAVTGIMDWVPGVLTTVIFGVVGYFHTRISRLSKRVSSHETRVAVLSERLDGIDEKLDEHGGRLAAVQADMSRVALAVARIEGRLNG